MTLVRLPAQRTDLVITVNAPHIKGQYARDDVDIDHGRLGKQIEAAQGYRDQMLHSLLIMDWTLFVQE